MKDCFEAFGCRSGTALDDLSLSVNKHSLFWTYCHFCFVLFAVVNVVAVYIYLSNLLLSCFCVQKGRSICQRREMLQVLL